MDISALLSRLEEDKVNIEVVDGQLKLTSKTEHISSDIIELVKSNKDKIIVELGCKALNATHDAAENHREQFGAPNILLASNFSIDPLDEIHNAWCKQLGYGINFTYAPYDQLFQLLLNSSSQFFDGKFEYVVLIVSVEKWDVGRGFESIRKTIDEFFYVLEAAYAQSKSSLVLLITDLTETASKKDSVREGQEYFIRESNTRLKNRKYDSVITPDEINRYYNVGRKEDAISAKVADMIFTNDYYVALASYVFRHMVLLLSKPYKVIVLDCDNTLWGGACSELGAQNVLVTDSWLYFHKEVKKQEQAGLLLCTCSKNVEEDVQSVFYENNDLHLKYEDFISHRINWEAKSKNIKSLAKELNLGLDSFVFIDDDPVQCAEVRANCPQVTVLEFPKNPDLIPLFVDHIWPFDGARFGNKNNRSRTERYRQNKAREEASGEAVSMLGFIESLNIEITYHELEEQYYPRAVELMMRVNQFNLTGEIIKEQELAERVKNNRLHGFLVEVSDRFGDYGVVGLVLYTISERSLNVFNYLLSCRSLARGVEYQTFNELGKIAKAKGLVDVRVDFKATKKNEPARVFLEGLKGSRKNASDRNAYAFDVGALLKLDFRSHIGKENSVTDIDEARTVDNTLFTAIDYNKIANEMNGVAKIKDISQKSTRVPTKKRYQTKTPLQTELATIWSAVLGCKEKDINSDDSFFYLGGNSIKGVRVIAEITRKFDVVLNLRELFEHPRLDDFSILLDSLLVSAAERVEFPSVDVGERIPLSFNQERIWLLEKLNSFSNNYMLSAFYKVKETVDSSALKRALEYLIRRHDVLRVEIEDGEDGPYQFVNDIVPAKLEIIDFSQHEKRADIDTAILKLREGLLSSELYPHGSTLFDIKLIEINPRSELKMSSIIMINMHHLITDEWSFNIFLSELFELYDCFVKSRELELKEVSQGFTNIVKWQASRDDEIAKNSEYWKKELLDVDPAIKLPVDYRNSSIDSGSPRRSAFEYGVIPDLLSYSAKKFCAENNITLFVWLLSAYSIVLSKYSGKDTFTIGLPVAGRDGLPDEPVIGFFINSLMIKFCLDENPSVPEYLNQVKNKFFEAIEHQNIKYDNLISTINENARLGNRSGVFDVDVAFNMLGEHEGTALVNEKMALSLTEHYPNGLIDEKIAERDLVLSIQKNKDKLEYYFEYDASKFEATTIKRLAEQYLHVLQELINNSQLCVKDLSLVSERQIGSILGVDNVYGTSLFPVSKVQSDILFDSILNPEIPEYSIGLSYEFKKGVDIGKWKHSLQALTNNFPILRTRIITSNHNFVDYFYQLILSSDEPVLEIIDLESQKSFEDIESVVQDKIYQPINPIDSPLIKHYLIKGGEQQCVYVMQAHHSIFDGASLEVFWNHLKQIYVGDSSLLYLENKKNDFGFFNYAIEKNKGVDSAKTLNYWKAIYSELVPLRYAGVVNSALLEVDFNHKTHIHQSDLELDTNHWRQIRSYCKKNRITPAIYFKCLYALLVSVSCRAKDRFAIYEIISDRLGYKDSMGCFIQRRPVVIDAAVISFSELLEQYKCFHRDARSNADFSLAEQNRLGANGDLSFSYTFKNFESGEAINQEEEYSGKGYSGVSSKVVDFSIVTYLGDLAPKLEFKFSRAIFSDEEFLQRLVHVSFQIVEGNVDKISNIEVVTENERRNQLITWNDTVSRYNVSTPVHDQFRDCASLNPHAIAAVCEGQTISYKSLDMLSNRIARHLQSLGVLKGDFVGLYMNRSTEFLAAMLGVLKADATYIPFDASYPNKRTNYMVKDSKVRTVISLERHIADENLFRDIRVLCLDKEADAIDRQSSEKVISKSSPEDSVYMLYTSGSTGEPKGALIRHDGALNHVHAEIDQLGLKASCNILQTAPISSDMSFWQFIAPVLSGGKVVIVENPADANQIIETIKTHKVNLVELVPSILSLVMDRVENSGLDKADFSSLVCVMATGELVPTAVINRWCGLFPSIPIVNAYGPTEASDDVIQSRITQPISNDIIYAPIGKPINNMNAYILDENLNLLPTGVVGEICVSGIGVGSGYWNNEIKTKEKFVENPFEAMLGKTVYKTGDLGRWLSNGDIECLGRVDHQVSIRGHRVEIGEIESHIRRLENIDSVAVKLCEIRKTEETLVAFIVGKEIETTGLGGIKYELEKSLPSYMIPKYYIPLDRMPLNAVGKIDYAKLPIPKDTEISRAEYVPPENETQRSLVDIWSEVLNVSETLISITDSFFDLGGHSLLAARLAVKIEEKLGKNIPLADLFLNPSIQKQEQILNSLEKTSSSTEVSCLTKGTKIPLSYTQLEYWFIYLYSNNPWTINDAFIMNSQIDVELLRESILRVLNTSGIFNMKFSRWIPLQEYSGAISQANLQYHDVSCSDEDIFTKSEDLLTEFVNREIDISVSPNCEFLLIKRAESEYIFCSKFSHLTVDAYAQSLFMRDLLNTYYKNTTSNKLNYVINDYVGNERNQFGREKIAEEKVFWNEYLKGARKLEVGNKHKTIEKEIYHATGVFTDEVVEVIRLLEQKHDCPSLVVFINLISGAIAEVLNQEDFCVKYYSENRFTNKMLSLVAPMMTEGVLRYQYSGSEVVTSLLNVKKQYLKVLAHNNLPWMIPVSILERNYASRIFRTLSPLFRGISSFVAKKLLPSSRLYPEIFFDYISFLNSVKIKSSKSPIDVTVNVITNIEPSDYESLGESALRIKRHELNNVNKSLESEMEALNFVIKKDEEGRYIYSVYGGGLKDSIYKELESEMLKEIAKHKKALGQKH